jgi:hypothetical protein
MPPRGSVMQAQKIPAMDNLTARPSSKHNFQEASKLDQRKPLCYCFSLPGTEKSIVS